MIHKNQLFGIAIEGLKAGNLALREGWNGKKMFLFYVQGDPEFGDYLQPEAGQKSAFSNVEGRSPYIAMKTVDNKIVPWLASQTDVLAEDWIFGLHDELMQKQII